MLKKLKPKSLRKQISAAGILGIVITVLLSIISIFSYKSLKNTQEQEAKQYFGINDWNLFCVVPQDYLCENFSTLMTVFIVIMLCITALFSVLFFYIYHIIKRSREERIPRLAHRGEPVTYLLL